MKRMTASILFVLTALIIITLVGCGVDKNKDLGDITASSDNSNNNQGKNKDNKEKTVIISLGYSTGENDPRGVASNKFKEIVEEKTKGRIIIKTYPDGSLGDDKELILGVINSDVDMTISSAGNFANYSSVGVSAFPFLFNDFNEAWKFMDSNIVKELNNDLEQFNIYVLAHFDNGFRCITTSEDYGPINSLSDLEGLKIRVPSNQIVQETMSQLGANPYQLAFTELYDALKKHEFEAQENPIPIIYNSRFYEVQKYLAITNHSYDAMPFVIRNDVWNELSDNDKDIIQEAALEAQRLNRELVQKQTKEYISLLEEEGMVITYPDLSEFEAKTVNVYDYFRPSYGDDLIDKVKNWNK